MSKGKVESVIKYEELDSFVGSGPMSLQERNARTIAWCREVDKRPHGTTGIPPIERLENVERKELRLVCNKPRYMIVQKAPRMVSKDCYVSYLGNMYSVPWKYARREVLLLIHDGKFDVSISGEIVYTHELRAGSGGRVHVDEHFKGLYKAIRDQNQRRHEKSLSIQVRLPVEPQVEQRPLAVYDQVCQLGGA